MADKDISPLEEYLLTVDDPKLLREFWEMQSIIDDVRTLLFHQGGIAPALKLMDKIKKYDNELFSK